MTAKVGPYALITRASRSSRTQLRIFGACFSSSTSSTHAFNAPPASKT